MATFICPYCFERCNQRQVEFRCTNKRCNVMEDDLPMSKYLGIDVSKDLPVKGKKAFSPGGFRFGVARSASCPDCKQTSYKIICPACHNELPESSLTGQDMIISVVGSRSTGKSHFVGVIIHELINRIAGRLGGSMEGFADSYGRYQANFENNLYRTGVKLELTKSAINNTDVAKPLIFKFRIQQGRKIQCFTFVFFDTAGEDLNDEDTMSTVNKYICKSAGIIFLLDPMQIQNIANKLDSDWVRRASGINGVVAAADDIMTRVSNLIRNDQGLPSNAKIKIPVAAVFSKFDAIEKLVPEDFVVRTPSPHCKQGRFDKDDWSTVNSEIYSMLDEWGATAFTSQLENNYMTYSYFAVSALGLNNNPSDKGNIDIPHPHRIEDPLLWLMRENGVLK